MSPNKNSVVIEESNVGDEVKRLESANRLAASKVGFAGIKWRTSQEDIDLLNAIVFRKTSKFVEESKLSGKALSPEVHEVHINQRPVYKKRWSSVPILYGGISIIVLIYFFFIGIPLVEGGANVPIPKAVLLSALLCYLWYDLFSGILHVVLDNPDFISTPILNDPCLEFQWHHHIPLDLCSKSFWEVCGDLTVTISIIGAIMLAPIGLEKIGLEMFCIRNPIGYCLMAGKVLSAYFGQMCHMCSHMPSNQLPNWAKFLQSYGLMVSPREHNVHHRTYNDNFCIGTGICNPIISGLLKVTSNKWIWLALFLSVASFDVPILNYLLTDVLKMEQKA